MNDKYKYLSKNVGLFALSGFIPKALSFILIPIYTSILTTAEYGIADLITTTVSLLIPILSVDIQDAVMRFALDKDYDQKDVFSIGFKIVLIGTAIVSCGALVVSHLSILGIESEYLMFVAIMFFTTASYNVCSLFCRGIDHVKSITIASIINSVVTLSCNILFLVVFKWGLTGYLTANTLGAFIAILCMFISAKLYRYIGLSTNHELFREMLRFSTPLIFSVVAWWINSASDRYILTWFCGVGVSGLYAVAYKIPVILKTLGNVFTQAWSISAIKEFDKDDSDGFFGRTFELIAFAMAFSCSVVMVLNIPIASMLYAKDFFSAWQYVPFILLAVVFDILCLFIGGVFTATKDTSTLSMTTIIGAVVNIALNMLMIPTFGAYGAAIATLMGYCGVFIARVVIVHKHINMHVSWSRFAVTYLLIVAQIIVALFGILSIPIQIIFAIIIVILHRLEAASMIGFIMNVQKSKLKTNK